MRYDVMYVCEMQEAWEKKNLKHLTVYQQKECIHINVNDRNVLRRIKKIVLS